MLQQQIKNFNLLKIVLVILVIGFFLSIYFHTDSSITQDLGRHITLGEIILSQKSVPNTNLFSYTHPNFPFVNHHWASEVAFFVIYNFGGINSLILFSLFVVGVGFFAISLLSLKKSLPLLWFFINFLSLQLLRQRTDIRPEIFAYFFFPISYLILIKEKSKPSKLIFLLPFIQLLWTNLHISFVYSFVIYISFFIDRLIAKKLRKKYIIVLFLLFIASFINPNGIKGVLYPIQIFNNYGYSIVENQSVFFIQRVMNNQSINYFFAAVSILVLLTPILLNNSMYFSLIIAFFSAMTSIYMIRHFPFFALSIIYPLSVALTVATRAVRIKNLTKSKKLLIKTIVSGILILFFLNETYLLVTNRYYAEKKHSSVTFGLGQIQGMKKTLDFFVEEQLKGPIFNNFDIGSYLIYRLYPQERVFIDGRPEAYPKEFIQNIYIPIQEKEDKFTEYSSQYNFSTIVFSHTDMTPWAKAFLYRIVRHSDWQFVYFDDWGVIVVRRDLGEHFRDISLYSGVFEDYARERIKEYSDTFSLTNIAIFFSTIGRKDLTDLTLLKLNSISAESYY